jgi:formylglycine-generating enzyme required for sulfatase activity
MGGGAARVWALLLLVQCLMVSTAARAFAGQTFTGTGKYKYSESESMASMRQHVKEIITQDVLQSEVGGYSQSLLNMEKQESTAGGGVRSSSTQSITQILAGYTRYRVLKEWTDDFYFNTTAEVTVDLEATRRKLDEIAAERKKEEQETSHIGQRKQEALEREKAALEAENGLLQKQATLAGQQAGLAQQQADLERSRADAQQSIEAQKAQLQKQAALNTQVLALAEQQAALNREHEGRAGTLPQLPVLAASPAGVPANFVYIRGGSFTMGSPENEPGHESNETRHQVRVSDYYMGKYEVTQAEWESVTGTNPSYFKGVNLPVESVSWDDCQSFIETLNRKTGKTYRLPTEAEWEYACRAGRTTPFNTGGNLTTDQANYDGNYPYNNNQKGIYRQNTVAVNSFTPNAWGLYNMHGNVWEWCSDLFDANYYAVCNAKGVVFNPENTATGSLRVLRGGSWISLAALCRSASRLNTSPGHRYYLIGFRLVFVP